MQQRKHWLITAMVHIFRLMTKTYRCRTDSLTFEFNTQIWECLRTRWLTIVGLTDQEYSSRTGVLKASRPTQTLVPIMTVLQYGRCLGLQEGKEIFNHFHLSDPIVRCYKPQ